MPRSPVTAPPGYVTVPELAARAGVSYDVAYARVTSGAVRSERTDDGYLVPEDEIARVTAVRPSDPLTRPRVNVAPRVSEARFRRWASAAKAAGVVKVSTWAGALADQEAARLRAGGRPARAVAVDEGATRPEAVSIQVRQGRYREWLEAAAASGYSSVGAWVIACADRAASRLRK